MQHCAIHCFTIYAAIRDRCHGEGHACDVESGNAGAARV